MDKRQMGFGTGNKVMSSQQTGFSSGQEGTKKERLWGIRK